MKEQNQVNDRDMEEIAISLGFMSEDLQELAAKFEGQTRHDYLGDELRKLHAIRTKLNYNIDRLEKMTGQSEWTQAQFPF